MLVSLFSPFDTHVVRNIGGSLPPLFWLLPLLLLLPIQPGLFIYPNTPNTLLKEYASIPLELLKRSPRKVFPEFPLYLSATFITLVTLNLLALLPYTFAFTAHIHIALAVALTF